MTDIDPDDPALDSRGHLRPLCNLCGPGYRIGDDGCRHTDPDAHASSSCTCNLAEPRRDPSGLTFAINERCPQHGSCSWVDCDRPGWHEHQVGDEWWVDDNGDQVCMYVHVRGLVLISRNALAALLERAGYAQVEAPRALCEPPLPGEDPPRMCDATEDCQADDHMLCCQSPSRRSLEAADD